MINRVSTQVAEIERLNKETPNFFDLESGVHKGHWTKDDVDLESHKSKIQTTLKIFKAESKNIITRATEELEFLKLLLPIKTTTQKIQKFLEKDSKLKQEIKDWKNHLKWLEKQ